MYQFTPIHLAISKKLGWGDMLAKIALPAIDCIISHFLGLISDATGDVLPIDAAEVLVTSPAWTPDEIFGLLCTDGGDPMSSPVMQFIGLREEIETYMRRGMDFESAINEWYK